MIDVIIKSWIVRSFDPNTNENPRKSVILMRVINLSHKGVSRLGNNFDFALKMGDYNLECTKSQISFISPYIYSLLLSDPTINQYELKTLNTSSCIPVIQSLLNGLPASLPLNQINILYAIALELKNDELLSLVNVELMNENVIEIMKAKYNLSLDIEREIQYIASHFYELNKEMHSLDLTIIDSIISSRDLIVMSEHELFNFISSLININGDEYRYLLKYLCLEYLDNDDMKIFVHLIEQSDVEDLLPCIYRRLLCKVAYYPLYHLEKRRFRGFVPYTGHKFQGIFSLMWKWNKACPLEKGLINIEETTDRSISSVPYLIDPEKRNQTDWYCVTNNVEGAGFIIDFKDKKVQLSGYSLKAHSIKYSNTNFVKSWIVEGSNSKNRWKTIDYQKSNLLQSNLAEGYWPCEKSSPYRYFRILMTDKNTSGYNYFALHAIELFGSISTE